MKILRKIFSILFFFIFLAALPGLFNGLKTSSDPGFLIGLALVPIFFLWVSIRLWKTKAPKTTEPKDDQS